MVSWLLEIIWAGKYILIPVIFPNSPAKSLELSLNLLFFLLPTTGALGIPVGFTFKIETGYFFIPSTATTLV